MLRPELENCRLCPHECGVNRYYDVGFCQAGADAAVNLAQLHYGEEPVLSGTRGSGTIFFSHCNLRCVFCQNYSISHQGWGKALSIESLAGIMLDLQNQGAHNINLVSPTQFTPQIKSALTLGRASGLQLSIVWNSNAYEKPDTLQSLRGLVDIWLPDYKYAHAYYAKKYSGAKDYPGAAISALEEMVKQAGFLQVDSSGIATQGVLVRHLVLPNMVPGSLQVLGILRDRFGSGLPLSLMAQYYPAGEANMHPELSRGITKDEYDAVLDRAAAMGFTNVYVQELSCDASWTPRFRDTGSG